VSQGSYNLTAKATDNLGVSTTTSVVPVSVTASVAKIYDIHADHLGTPRMVTDASGNAVWEWIGTPFGESLPNQNPSNTGVQNDFVMNLRFPGQVFDKETNLHYNYFRDYDPKAGRYVESDPIGLKAGVNTFGYVLGNPAALTDRFGLWSTAAHNLIIQRFGQATGMTPAQILAMQKGSLAADNLLRYQGADKSYMHAMSSSSLSKYEACKKSQKHVDDYVGSPDSYGRDRNLFGKDDVGNLGPWVAGFGLHAVMDSTSPPHADFMMWKQGDMFDHGFWGSSKENNPTEEQIWEAVKNMMDAINGKFKFNCECYNN